MERLNYSLGRTVFIVFGVVLYCVSSAIGENSEQDETSADAESQTVALIYDVKLGFFGVGVTDLELTTTEESYELKGDLNTGGTLGQLLNLHGEFVATGTLVEQIPTTKTFTMIEEKEKKQTRKEIIVKDQMTTIKRTDRDDWEFATPSGNDFMTTLFAYSSCQDEMQVFDEDETFMVRLKEEVSDKKLSQGRQYVSGLTTQCQYEFIYDDDETRRVDIWFGEFEDRIVPVRVQIRIRFLPSGIFKLRKIEKSI